VLHVLHRVLVHHRYLIETLPVHPVEDFVGHVAVADRLGEELPQVGIGRLQSPPHGADGAALVGNERVGGDGPVGEPAGVRVRLSF